MVGDRRIELLTSSVSRKRSTSELTTQKQNAKHDTKNYPFVKFQSRVSPVKVCPSVTDK